MAESTGRSDVGLVKTGSNRLIDDFDGDDAVQHAIPSPVYRPLAASGYPFKDFVSADSLEHRCCRGLYLVCGVGLNWDKAGSQRLLKIVLARRFHQD